MSQNVPASAAPGEGTTANPVDVLGLEASTAVNLVVAEKLLQGFILLSDKEEVDKLNLDRAITRFLHFLNQVITSFQIMLVLLYFQCSDKFCFS